MTLIVDLKPGDVVSFELKTKVIKNSYTNCVVEGIVGYSMATMYSDVDAIHANIIGTLPSDTPASASEYNYLVVKLPTGEKQAVGVPWIREPVNLIDGAVITAIISGVHTTDVVTVTRALTAYGFTDVEIRVKSHNAPAVK